MDIYEALFIKRNWKTLKLSPDLTLIIGKHIYTSQFQIKEALDVLIEALKEKDYKILEFKMDEEDDSFRIELSGALHECFRIDSYRDDDDLITSLEMQNVNSNYFRNKKKGIRRL